MKRIYASLALMLVLGSSLSALNRQGYIVTKDAKIITGTVVSIFYSEWSSEITFMNDMGNIYKLQPWLIYGFSYRDTNEDVRFESKYEKGRWRFLKVLVKGNELNLYGCASRKTGYVRDMSGLRTVIKPASEYWLEPKEKFPIRVFQVNFKRKLKKYLDKNKAPDIIERLGSLGYRYQDLPKIIEEYNELCKKEVIKI